MVLANPGGRSSTDRHAIRGRERQQSLQTGDQGRKVPTGHQEPSLTVGDQLGDAEHVGTQDDSTEGHRLDQGPRHRLQIRCAHDSVGDHVPKIDLTRDDHELDSISEAQPLDHLADGLRVRRRGIVTDEHELRAWETPGYLGEGKHDCRLRLARLDHADHDQDEVVSPEPVVSSERITVVGRGVIIDRAKIDTVRNQLAPIALKLRCVELKRCPGFEYDALCSPKGVQPAALHAGVVARGSKSLRPKGPRTDAFVDCPDVRDAETLCSLGTERGTHRVDERASSPMPLGRSDDLEQPRLIVVRILRWVGTTDEDRNSPLLERFAKRSVTWGYQQHGKVGSVQEPVHQRV